MSASIFREKKIFSLLFFLFTLFSESTKKAFFIFRGGDIGKVVHFAEKPKCGDVAERCLAVEFVLYIRRFNGREKVFLFFMQPTIPLFDVRGVHL